MAQSRELKARVRWNNSAHRSKEDGKRRERGRGEGNQRNADINTVDEKVNAASKREGEKELK